MGCQVRRSWAEARPPSSLYVSIQGKLLKPSIHAGSNGVEVDGGAASYHFLSTSWRVGGSVSK